MSFLAPFYLLLAAAGGVPLLLHLMRRRVGARVDFPAARYLRRAEREHSRSLRLRNLLLMLLRVLAVVMLALAAARPFVPAMGTGHGPTALAIVLDNSLSTTAVVNGATVLDQLREAASALVRAAEPTDRLWLVTADGGVRAGSRAALLDALVHLRASEGSGDLALALHRAAAALHASGLPTQRLAVATDGQRSAWRAATRVAPRISVLVPAGAPPPNRAVAAAGAEPARFTPGGAITARVDTRDSVGYRLVVGEQVVARGFVGPREPIFVRATPALRGWQAGRVELAPDDFHADDQRWFALWVGPPPAVDVGRGTGPFVATATGTLVAQGRIVTGQGTHIATADAAATLPALLVPPDDPVRVGAANRALARLGIPWRFGARVALPGVARGDGLDGIAVTERYALLHEGDAPSDTLTAVGGTPWIVAGPGYVLLGSRLDPAATALPLRAPFVPWLARTLSVRLSAGGDDLGAPIEALPALPVTLPSRVDALENAAGTERRPVEVGRTTAPAQRGVWFLLHRGRRIGALVVNAPPEESELARWEARPLADRIGGAGATAASRGDAWVRSTFAAESRRPALTPLLLLALLLLGAEAFVVRAPRHSRTAA